VIVETLRRAIQRLAVADVPWARFCAEADAVLRRAVPWDVSSWGTVDPATLLATGCVVMGLEYDPGRDATLFALEHTGEDVNRFVDVARANPPVAALHAATGGRPGTSRRYRELLAPLGICDEVRVALVDSRTCWGSLYAYRRADVFTADEVGALGAVAADLARAVRLCLLRAAAQEPGEGDEPGLLVLAPDGSVVTTTAPAARWLDLLGGRGGVPPVIRSVAAALRRPDPHLARARVQAGDGRWLIVHAAHAMGTDGAVALVVEPARPLEVADVLAAAYGFTGREREVVGLVLRGEPNRLIARALGIGEYTVKEYLKAVFAKAGVASRGELAARLLAEQYVPRTAAGLRPGPYGWFRDVA
jgi:DNA-binding CsgD family transcriptional regulator/GAF domain-containing protein